MATWGIVAAIGGILSVIGILIMFRRFQQEKINLLTFFSIIIGYISFVTFVLFESFYPESVNSVKSFLILLPALAALVILIHQNQHTKKISE